jgi:hypothetical protein
MMNCRAKVGIYLSLVNNFENLCLKHGLRLNKREVFKKLEARLVFVQNVGWRLDYVLVSERLADSLVDCIHRSSNMYSIAQTTVFWSRG